jgi:hypothetical protein
MARLRLIASALLALVLLIGAVEEANAVVCRAGVYAAGCASARGTAVARRPYGAAAVRRPYGAAAVVRPAGACVWRAGVRVCR